MAGIVWLASYPKSGNAWLRVFLANLIADQGRPVPLTEIARYAAPETLMTRFKRFAPPGIDPADNAQVIKVRAEVQSRLASGVPGQVLLATHNMLAAFAGAPLVSMKVSQAAVYVVRNPLDIVPDFAGMYGEPADWAIERLANPTSYLAAAEDRIFEHIGDWSGHVESWTGPDRRGLLVLRYEDMTAEPLEAFGQVMRHLDIDKPPAALKRAVEFTVAVRERSAAAAEGRDDSHDAALAASMHEAHPGGWRDVLTPGQVDRIVARHRTQMERYGYIPDRA